MPDFDDAALNAAAPFLNAAIAAHGLEAYAALIYGQCDLESQGFNPNAFANDRNGGSYGLMQMSFPTAQGLGYTGTADGLFDPATSADLGCALMAQLLARYSGDVSKALAAYNAGPGNLAAGASYANLVQQKAAWFADLFASQQPDPSSDTIDTGSQGASSILGPVATVGAALALGYALYRAIRP